MFPEKYFNYGVIKVDGHCIWLYCGQYDRSCISVNADVVFAKWSGRALLVQLANEPNYIRRYENFGEYHIVYV